MHANKQISGVIERVAFHNGDRGFYRPAVINGRELVNSLKLLFDQFG
jgi:hypothetical protein